MKPKYLIASAVAAMLASVGVVSVRRAASEEFVRGTVPSAPAGMQPTPCQLHQGVQTAAGTVLSICATTPPTFDSTGYGSSNMFYTAIGEVTDMGSHGKTFAEITHKPIGSRGTRKFKGSFDIGTKTVQMGLDQDDAGQIIAMAAADSDNDYSFRMAYPNGDIDYFQAKVMSFVKAVTGVDTIVSATMQLSLTSSSAGVGIIAVNAP